MTGKIRVYPSTLPGIPVETYEASGTVGAWLSGMYPEGYKPGHPQPFILTVDGVVVPPEAWDKTEITENTCLHFKAQGGVLEGLGSIISSVVSAVFGFLLPSAPSASQRQTTEGVKLKAADAKANQAKLGDVIPEVAGLFRRYPEYLLPPHRYFVNQREQWLELLLCVGKGKYQIPNSRVRIGETPLINLGPDAEFTIYQPGADLSSDNRAKWWQPVAEVGGSALGSAGLTLTNTSAVAPVPDATVFTFDEFSISIPAGAGSFPDGWAGGFLVRVEQYLDYTITADGLITGNLEQLDPFPGMLIEIEGPNAGFYKVDSYDDVLGEMVIVFDDDSPVSGLLSGTRRMAIGYRGLLYRITAAGEFDIEVDRLTDTGATDSAWPGFDLITTSDAVLVLDESNLEGDWSGPFAACPEGEVTDRFEWDVFFPGGLTRIGGKGRLNNLSVTVEVQWRNAATAGAWSSTTKTYTARTLDQIGYTETQLLGSTFRPEVRMRRIGAESTDTQEQDKVQWYGLRSLLNAPVSYEGVTTLALRIRGGDRLAAQSENQISVEATRVLPVRADGEWQVETPTRSIAAFVAYIARSIGYTDEQIDFDELDRLDLIWSGRQDFYDWVCDETTVRDALNEALQAGFSELTIDRGLIRPVRDEPRTVFDQMYSPQNMRSPLSRSFSAISPDEADGVDVQYTDSLTWSKETVQCRLPGDAGVKVQKVTLNGVTNRNKAWRIGMRIRRESRFRRWNYDFNTELDGLVSGYLSYCAVATDVPGYGKSCIVDGAESVAGGVLLTVSEPIEFTGSDLVGIRREDGTLDGPYTALPGDSEFEVIAQGMIDPPVILPDREPPHAVIGSTERWSFPVLIQSIRPNGFDSVSLGAVNYAPEVYADDENSAPV